MENKYYEQKQYDNEYPLLYKNLANKYNQLF